eukprot:4251429-Amphidinium_carterae.2
MSDPCHQTKRVEHTSLFCGSARSTKFNKLVVASISRINCNALSPHEQPFAGGERHLISLPLRALTICRTLRCRFEPHPHVPSAVTWRRSDCHAAVAQEPASVYWHIG